MLRNYFLREIKRPGERIAFHLIFTTYGEMFIEQTVEIDAPAFKRTLNRIPLADLDKHQVSGKTLRQLVEAKFSEILPPSS